MAGFHVIVNVLAMSHCDVTLFAITFNRQVVENEPRKYWKFILHSMITLATIGFLGCLKNKK